MNDNNYWLGQKRKVFNSYYVLKNVGRLGRDRKIYIFYYFYSLTHTIPRIWTASIKFCLVVIVFICINFTFVYPEIDTLMVGGYFWVGTVHFSAGLVKETLG